jgi:prevent-host-death family protein
MRYMMYKKIKEGEGALTVAEARQGFAEVLNRVAYGKSRLVVTRHGKRLAAVIPIEDLEVIERLEDAHDVKEARRALADVRRHGTIGWDRIKRDRKL